MTMSKNLTTFLYLKTLQKTEHTNFELSHTLFHLQRYLFLNGNVKWDRMFFLTNSEGDFVDVHGGIVINLLAHHDLIVTSGDSREHTLNEKGNSYLRKLQLQLPEIDKLVEEFFTEYDGETVFANSCMSTGNKRTVACHLCTETICVEESSWLAEFKRASGSLFKNPYRSYSKTASK